MLRPVFSSEATSQFLLDIVAGPGSSSNAELPNCHLGRYLRDQIAKHIARLLQRVPEDSDQSVLELLESNWTLIEHCKPRLQPGFGQLGLRDASIAIELARLAFLLFGLGAKGTCTIRLENACVLYLDDIPMVVEGSSKLYSDGSSFMVEQHQDCVQFVRSSLGWQATAEAPLTLSPPVVVRVVGASDNNSSAAADFLGDLRQSKVPHSELAQSLASAWAFVSLSTKYANWLALVLRSVQFVSIEGDGSSSGSSERHPGLVFVSHPMPADHLAVQLVHECAHQYLNLGHEVEALADRHSAKLYFSPFRNHQRPIYSILLALHAAVHMRSFIGDLLSQGCSTSYLLAEHQSLKGQIETMLDQINSSSANDITVAGGHLVARLAQMQHATN